MHYATIIETHHPDYLSQDELDRLYDFDAASPMSIDELQSLVDLVLDKH